MTVAFKNFASTTLAGGISAVDTSLTLAVTTGANFPATSGNAWFYLTLVNALENPTAVEIVKVTTRSGDTCSVIERARDGTTAQAWPSGTYAQLRLTEGTFADLTVQYANNADNLSNLASAATSRTNLGLGTMATQNATAVAITGGTASNLTLTTAAFNGTLGTTTPSTVAATTISATGVITSTLASGTSPFTIASTTVVPNLNVSQLLGATWTAPGAIGSGTPSSGAFTTLSASGAVSGAGFTNYMASPPAIGGSIPAAGFFTTITGTTIRATTYINYRGGDNASATNSGFGESALDSNAGGLRNVAVGNSALTANTTGDDNTAVGRITLSANTTGGTNTAIGSGAMEANTSGDSNVAIGYQSLRSAKTGIYNVALGYQALKNFGGAVSAGSFIIGVTYVIDTSGTTVFTSIGAADNNPGTEFTATGVGSGTGTATPTIGENIGIGYQSLTSTTSGLGNIAVGYASAITGTTGNYNISIGYQSLSTNILSSQVVGIGRAALAYIGAAETAGSFVVGQSYTILSLGTTDFTLIGAALNNVNVVFTATGVGVGTGTAAPNAHNNVGVGDSVGATLIRGANNTLVGTSANVTSANQTNSTALGYQATATLDNQVVLGNASVVEYKLPGTTAHVKYAGSYSSGAPVTETAATHSVAVSTSSLICNRAGTITVTLPSAATFTGRELRIKTITANTVVSAASNVVPLIGGAAGTAICAAVAGSWALLHSDGSNWVIMAA